MLTACKSTRSFLFYPLDQEDLKQEKVHQAFASSSSRTLCVAKPRLALNEIVLLLSFLLTLIPHYGPCFQTHYRMEPGSARIRK